jgi:hypothetical protein
MNLALDLLVSVVLAFAVSGVHQAARWFREWLDARKKLLLAQEQAFQAALSSNSLVALGQYLDESVGQFSLSEYTRNAKVRARVSMFLFRLQEFIGSSEDVVAEQESAPAINTQWVPPGDAGLAIVHEKLIYGEPWDALAALRRIIELRLTALAAQRGLELPSRLGAGQVLERLRRAEIVTSDVAVRLRYAIDIANRAIHGLDVSYNHAQDAIRNAQLALSLMGTHNPG